MSPICPLDGALLILSPALKHWGSLQCRAKPKKRVPAWEASHAPQNPKCHVLASDATEVPEIPKCHVLA